MNSLIIFKIGLIAFVTYFIYNYLYRCSGYRCKRHSDTLTELRRRYKMLNASYGMNEPGRDAIVNDGKFVPEYWMRVRSRFNPATDLYEIEFNPDATYTVDKDKIYMCTRSEKTGELYDINTLTIVMLHELAHIATVTAPGEDAHSENFWNTFKLIFDQASNIGIIQPWQRGPETYCGKSVNGHLTPFN